MSKDAVSRLVGRLREDFTAWAGAIWPRADSLPVPGRLVPQVRIGKSESGAGAGDAGGERERASRDRGHETGGWKESAASWLEVVQAWSAQLGMPALAVIDGNPGCGSAAAQWPALAIQRCTNHKLWNLLAKTPAHLREELRKTIAA